MPRINITFPYNRDKANQAVLWLLDKHGGQLDKLKLLKLLFFADRKHLAKYGRPIIGGKYYALKRGPILSELYDSVKSTGISGVFKVNGYKITSDGVLDEDFLSKSDIEVLREINDEYGDYDGTTLTEITHNLKAWLKNYPHPNENTSHPMSYEDIFIDLSPEENEILDVIKEDQEFWSALL